jgi:hypothetical protein
VRAVTVIVDRSAGNPHETVVLALQVPRRRVLRPSRQLAHN